MLLVNRVLAKACLLLRRKACLLMHTCFVPWTRPCMHLLVQCDFCLWGNREFCNPNGVLWKFGLPRYMFVQRWFQLEHASFPDRPIILQDDPSSPARSQSPGSTMLRQRTQLEVFDSLSGDRRADLCGFLSTASCSHASSATVLLPAAPGNTA